MAFNSSSLNSSLGQKLITAIILAVGFFLSAGMVVYLSLKGKEVIVPNLIGKSEAEAEKLLTAEGLRLKVRARGTADKNPPDSIGEQTPNSGAVVKAGQMVIVSLGVEPRKDEATAEAKPTATPTPKPKPKPKPSPLPSPGTETADKKPEGEKGGKPASTESNKGDSNKPKATLTPSPKASPKPTAKPSPKKPDTN